MGEFDALPETLGPGAHHLYRMMRVQVRVGTSLPSPFEWHKRVWHLYL
jgi:hypothetical protein